MKNTEICMHIYYLILNRYTQNGACELYINSQLYRDV